MTGISHKQVIKLINRRLDGLLNESQTLSLDEHLRFCDSCRAYSAELDLLSTRLQNDFHLRWNEDPGPSEAAFEKVVAKARNIPMKNRISSGVRLFAGFTALILLAFLVSFVVSRLQNSFRESTETEPAENSHREQERLIAFTSSQTGNLDIYTMRPDGSRLTNLTDQPANDFNPFWSPDGKRIAFESDRTGSTQIFLMDADGSNVTQLTDGEVDHRIENLEPWSPDGSKLIFKEKTQEDGKWMLYVMDADGQDKTQMVQTPQMYTVISWSADSKHVAFTIVEPKEDRDKASIYVVDTRGNNLTRVTELLPEDEVLKYWIHTLFRERNSITFTAGRDEGQSEGASRKIEEKARYAVYEASLDGNSLNEIANYYSTLGGDWWDGTALVEGIVDNIPSLTWLRSDGTSSTLKPFENCHTMLGLQSTYERSSNGNLMYVAQCGNGDKWLYWANPDGTEIKQLLDSPIIPKPGSSPIHNISLSPDGYSVAFNIASSDKTEMYILNVNEALKDPFIQPERFVVGGQEFTSYNISWQPGIANDIAEEKPTPEIEVKADHSPNLMIDPESCKPFADASFDMRPPDPLYGYELIQGAAFIDGDFSYEFWLYCDPSLKPDDNEHFSNVAGLGVYASWRYNGPEVEGVSQDYFGFEPVIKLKSFTKWIGPLYKASADGKFGMPAKETLLEHIRQGIPIQFSIIVDSGLGQNGATFSFHLEPTTNGVKITDLRTGLATTPYDGLIAFTSITENDNYEIYTMRPDGSGLTNLTDNPANDFNPFWSPDGKRIAFESNRTGSVQIFLMDADGSNLTQLSQGETEHKFRSTNPWSPDGNRLIFSETAPGEDQWILSVMDADGRNIVKLIQPPDYYGASSWSPDSQHIAFDFVLPLNNRDMTRIYVVDADGDNLTNVTKLLPDDEDLSSGNIPWAGDGKSLFFVAERYAWEYNNSRSAVYEASLDGTKLTEAFATSDQIDDWWNGTAFVHGRNAPPSPTWVRPDGTSSSFRPFENCQTRDSWGSIYRRSTNGNLLYGAVCDDGDLWLYWINSDGTAIRQLLDSPLSTKGGGVVDISWSPDDSFIAFTVAFPDKTEMYVLNVNEALKDPSIQPDKYVVGGPGFISYNISWQRQP